MLFSKSASKVKMNLPIYASHMSSMSMVFLGCSLLNLSSSVICFHVGAVFFSYSELAFALDLCVLTLHLK